MGNAKLLLCILVCLCVPTEPPQLFLLSTGRKPMQVPGEKPWAAPAQAQPRQFWGQGTTGFLVSEYKSAYRMSSLVWDCFP